MKTKPHFEILDGLRGTAALIIVVYHIFGMPVEFDPKRAWFIHAPLAVDFFFLLSGFVIAYAYDDRWGAMNKRQFFITRLIRLHPTLIIGCILGLLSYLFDPFKGTNQNGAISAVLLAFFGSLFVMPNAPLPNRWTDTHSLNGPTWTLLQEYIANIAYALVLRHLKTRTLMALSVLSGLVTIYAAIKFNTLDRGWGWDELWMAPTRLAFPFITGLWLYRIHDKIKLPKLGFWTLSLILLVFLSLPSFADIKPWPINGIFEALVVIAAFPAIVLCGAHSNLNDFSLKLSNIFGRISYPLYITHFPFLYIFLNFSLNSNRSLSELIIGGTLAFIVVTGFAYLILKFYDEPMRKTLKAKFIRVRTH